MSTSDCPTAPTPSPMPRRRPLQRYIQVLTAMTTAPDTPVVAVPALLPDEAEHERALQHSTPVPVVPDSVYDLLCLQFESSADEMRLVAGEKTFTFAEFFAEVNRYARVLLAHGVRPEHRVAQLLPRDERMVIAMFAVFAAGAAYVPVDAETSGRAHRLHSRDLRPHRDPRH